MGLTSFNDSWRFLKGDHPEARFPETDDSSWRSLRLPHDYAIEGEFRPDYESRTGHLPVVGTSWYRKRFSLPETQKGKRFSILFDGAMSNSEVWINGHFLGTRPSGYICFEYELTRYLRFGEDEHNVISVKLSSKSQASRWYPGAGIYRNVWLRVQEPVYLETDSIFITTETSENGRAQVRIASEVVNTEDASSKVKLMHRVYDSKGALVAKTTEKLTVPAHGQRTTKNVLSFANAALWDVDSPNLYLARTSVIRDGKLIDRIETKFGVRSIEFSNTNGFLLNGKKTKIKGVCLHHDLGPLGAAVNTAAIERRLKILKSMGVNAIRTSHNPPSPEFLNLCDELGFLVQVEAFDAWEMPKTQNGYSHYFSDWYERDLRTLIRRDRNHPSVFMWSIGNEILEQTDASKGPTIARKLNEICHEEDPTRPTTACFNYYPDPVVNGLAAEVDIVGLNYHPASYGDLLEKHPEWIVYGSETASTVSSRGVYHLPMEKYDNHDSHQITSYDLVGPAWAYPPDIEFHFQEKHPNLLGEFIWTGFDYIGEPTPYAWSDETTNSQSAAWPSRSSYFGAIDLCGFPKDRYYLYKSQWTEEPMVHLLPHWNWQEMTGQTIPVFAYSNCDEVELFLNGETLGRRRVGMDTTPIPVDFYNHDETSFETKYRSRWDVPYQPGELKVIGYRDGKAVTEDLISTAAEPATLRLTADRKTIQADGYDLSFIQVEILDENGNICPLADNNVQFELEGAGEIAAVGNGDPATNAPFISKSRKAFNGMCLVVVRSRENETGNIRLKALSDGLRAQELKLQVLPEGAEVPYVSQID